MYKWEYEGNFVEVKFGLLALTETKLKGNREVSWCRVNGIIASFQMERARAVLDFGCVSSRIFWIKFKFSRVKVCLVVGYGPNEGEVKKKNDMDRTLDSVGSGYRLSILRYLNGWIGDRTRAFWSFRRE